MNNAIPTEEIDLYIWEGNSDIAVRAERCLSSLDIAVLRTDPSITLAAPDKARCAVALVSVSVMGDATFAGQDWLKAHAVPVIWVASEQRGHDPRFYPPAYSHTLPLTFNCSELRAMVLRLAGARVAQASADRGATSTQPLVAVSPVMRALLADVDMYAGCDASVLIHGETGVGKERIAQRLHDQSASASGPFVAVNCGAVPDGLFEAHFFGHAKGAFTGAVGAHKGYFEQADNGTLFLDEIGDLPLYQQVKLLRVLEQRSITRLGSTTEIPVTFRLVSASHKDLRELVAEQLFRADLYYRLAVIELDIPNLETRGSAEKQAVFQALTESALPEHSLPIPPWLLERVGKTFFSGNIRELANLSERISIVVRQTGGWDVARLEQIFLRMSTFTAAKQAGMVIDATDDTPEFSDVEVAERERIVEALDTHGWRRLDTAAELGISRKVLWEKMRKFQIVMQGENSEA
ncbi:MAG: sigma-54-dependent Fis family transcriptional regulator [Burkholderiaceae bacterium]|nr:sigma-54-dependent Fis family transcriptional regulator [Burkholderiaceae bacterium]